MCGICGFVGPRDNQRLKKMTNIMRHRGPDAIGFHEADKCSLGHVRLSVIDLSNSSSQPMVHNDTQVAISYNGEIYNFKELRAELKSAGIGFVSDGDTEVVLQAYLFWGESFVSKLDGMFAIAIWDPRTDTLLLFRDRFGKKPLFYFHHKDGVVFGSEIKSILSSGLVPKSVNESAYFTYLSLQYCLDSEGIIQGLEKLAPASCVKFKVSNHTVSEPEVTTYWQLADHPTPELSGNKTEDLLHLLRNSVKKRLLSDVDLGVLLSGGIDSSAVSVLMAEETNVPINTFTIGFGSEDDEFPYARMVASQIGSKHQELEISLEDILENLPKIVWYLDEPLADGGGIATYFAARELKKHISVVLVGEGGDELFGGYSWHKLGTGVQKFIPEQLRRSLYFYLNSFAPPYIFNEAKREIYDLFELEPEETEGDFFKKMTNFERLNLLPNSLLMKVDRMTMAHGVEARIPFLDEDLLKFVTQLEGRERSGKRILKQALSGLIPQQILSRKKQGLRMPFTSWYKEELTQQCRELLLDENAYARRIFSTEQLENLFKPAHIPFARYRNEATIWRMTLFEYWTQNVLTVG